jgi:hypothetical protein
LPKWTAKSQLRLVQKKLTSSAEEFHCPALQGW